MASIEAIGALPLKKRKQTFILEIWYPSEKWYFLNYGDGIKMRIIVLSRHSLCSVLVKNYYIKACKDDPEILSSKK